LRHMISVRHKSGISWYCSVRNLSIPTLSPRPCVFTTTHPDPDSLFQGPTAGVPILLGLSTKAHLLLHHHGCSRRSVTAPTMASWHYIRGQAAMAPTLLLWPLPMFVPQFPVILPSSCLPFILSFWVLYLRASFSIYQFPHYCMNKKKLAHCFILAL